MREVVFGLATRRLGCGRRIATIHERA